MFTIRVHTPERTSDTRPAFTRLSIIRLAASSGISRESFRFWIVTRGSGLSAMCSTTSRITSIRRRLSRRSITTRNRGASEYHSQYRELRKGIPYTIAVETKKRPFTSTPVGRLGDNYRGISEKPFSRAPSAMNPQFPPMVHRDRCRETTLFASRHRRTTGGARVRFPRRTRHTLACTHLEMSSGRASREGCFWRRRRRRIRKAEDVGHRELATCTENTTDSCALVESAFGILRRVEVDPVPFCDLRIIRAVWYVVNALGRQLFTRAGFPRSSGYRDVHSRQTA
jgi:hypothetical protein